MQNLSVSDLSLEKKLPLTITEIAAKTRIFVAAFAVIGFTLPALYGYFFGFPVAHAQDELSYLVAADTYASGRLTNPTPAFFEHFETTHVIMEPSYSSKYPPLQGMFLAAGQIVFGHPAFGVWLSCAFFAASLFWMLSVWTRREWAIAGTILMITLVGINSYWAQSFWGGMIAAAGGALFFGGFRQILRKLSVGATTLMVLGGVVLVNSRPFEGTVTMIPALFVLFVWLLRDKENSFSAKLTRLVLPGFFIAGMAISAMCYQYYRVTGDPFKLPYSVHHAQYYPTPLFSFQEINSNATRGNARLRQIYESYTKPPILDSMLSLGLPDSVVLRSVYGFIFLIFALPFFLFSPILLGIFYICVPLALKRDRWLWLIAASVIFTYTCMAFGVWWDQYHYAAPLTACFFLFLIEGLRRFYESAQEDARRKIAAGFAILIVATFVYLNFYGYEQPGMKTDYSNERALINESLSGSRKVTIQTMERATFFKAEFEKAVEKSRERFLIFVSYDPKFNFHEEIIYNKADIAGAKLIWAHDLGEEKNKALTRFYGNRKILSVKLKPNEIEIEPFEEK